MTSKLHQPLERTSSPQHNSSLNALFSIIILTTLSGYRSIVDMGKSFFAGCQWLDIKTNQLLNWLTGTQGTDD